MVYFQSGLLGVSETSPDMRDLLEHEAQDVRASEAVALFCYQVKKCIGAFAAALGGVDTIVFSRGIGENAPAVRARILVVKARLPDMTQSLVMLASIEELGQSLVEAFEEFPSPLLGPSSTVGWFLHDDPLLAQRASREARINRIFALATRFPQPERIGKKNSCQAHEVHHLITENCFCQFRSLDAPRPHNGDARHCLLDGMRKWHHECFFCVVLNEPGE